VNLTYGWSSSLPSVNDGIASIPVIDNALFSVHMNRLDGFLVLVAQNSMWSRVFYRLDALPDAQEFFIDEKNQTPNAV
jgi:hypothetical protein